MPQISNSPAFNGIQLTYYDTLKNISYTWPLISFTGFSLLLFAFLPNASLWEITQPSDHLH